MGASLRRVGLKNREEAYCIYFELQLMHIVMTQCTVYTHMYMMMVMMTTTTARCISLLYAYYCTGVAY